MRYLSLNFGDEHCASSFYRIHTYRESLASLGVELICVEANRFSAWETVKEFDGVIVQKKLFSRGRVGWIRRQTRRLIYDIDDAIWLPHKTGHHWITRLRTGWRLKEIVARADVTLVANEKLASHLRPWSEKVVVFPMALDENLWQPADPALRVTGTTVHIGWSGAPGNLRYLEALDPVFQELKAAAIQFQLVVICGQRPNLSIPYDFVPWRPGIEPRQVAAYDIGLLPLPLDDPFASCKSPIKGLQYLACGVPVVATPTDATVEMFRGADRALFARTQVEWFEALARMIRDSEFRGARAERGLELFRQDYSLQNRIPTLVRHLQG